MKCPLTLLMIYERTDNETSDIQLVEIPNNRGSGNGSFLIPYDGKGSEVCYTFLAANRSKLFHFLVLLLHGERGTCHSKYINWKLRLLVLAISYFSGQLDKYSHKLLGGRDKWNAVLLWYTTNSRKSSNRHFWMNLSFYNNSNDNKDQKIIKFMNSLAQQYNLFQTSKLQIHRDVVKQNAEYSAVRRSGRRSNSETAIRSVV